MREPNMFLVDATGQPFSPRIEQAVLAWLVRLRSGFPTLDDNAVVEVLEDAAARVVRREARAGAIEHLHAYAWTAIRSVAVSRLRLGIERVSRLATESWDDAARTMPSPPRRWAVDVESQVALSQMLGRLTPLERRVVRLKMAGYSTCEIAARVGRAPATVDSLYSRAIARLRRIAIGTRANTRSDAAGG